MKTGLCRGHALEFSECITRDALIASKTLVQMTMRAVKYAKAIGFDYDNYFMSIKN